MTWDELADRIRTMTPAQRAFEVRYVEPYDEFDVLRCRLEFADPGGIEATDAATAAEVIPFGMPYLTP